MLATSTAVFVDPDGGACVVDWKTGKPPHGPKRPWQAAVQLADSSTGLERIAGS